MARRAQREKPITHRCDEEGQLRLLASSVTFPSAMDAAFNQIRQYGCRSVAGLVRLLEAFTSLAECARREEEREAIRKHADIVLRTAGRSFTEEEDLQVVRQRLVEAARALERR